MVAEQALACPLVNFQLGLVRTVAGTTDRGARKEEEEEAISFVKTCHSKSVRTKRPETSTVGLVTEIIAMNVTFGSRIEIRDERLATTIDIPASGRIKK